MDPKAAKRAAKEAARAIEPAPSGTQDCACVIHGNKYDWQYVEKLYSMITRNSSLPIRFHVFTEHDRSVPGHMIKHSLIDWPGISGPKKSWWYKLQMFDPQHIQGRVLYLDLDTVIVRDIDWLWGLSSKYFWTIRDFRYLWRSNYRGINSSVMLWDTIRFKYIWRDFCNQNLQILTRQYHGDQDYLTAILSERDLRFIDEESVKSWRWQIKDGGMDFRTRLYRRPDAGSVLDPKTRIMVFHGSPNPHEINDPVIRSFWN